MRWTGKEARVLRETALRMTMRDFACHTNLSTYTIRDLEAKGEQTNLRISTQKILDATLAGAPEDARQRFAAALGLVARRAAPLDDIGIIGWANQPGSHAPAHMLANAVADLLRERNNGERSDGRLLDRLAAAYETYATTRRDGTSGP